MELGAHSCYCALAITTGTFARRAPALPRPVAEVRTGCDESFPSALRAATALLHELCHCSMSLGSATECWDSWVEFVKGSPGRWKSLIKRALALSVHATALLASLESACKATWDPHDVFEAPAEWQHACLPCRFAFPTRQHWGAHADRSHGYQAKHTLLFRVGAVRLVGWCLPMSEGSATT